MSTTDEVKVGPSRIWRTTPPYLSVSFEADLTSFNRAMKRLKKALRKHSKVVAAKKAQRDARLSQMHTAYRARSRRRTRSRR